MAAIGNYLILYWWQECGRDKAGPGEQSKVCVMMGRRRGNCVGSKWGRTGFSSSHIVLGQYGKGCVRHRQFSLAVAAEPKQCVCLKGRNITKTPQTLHFCRLPCGAGVPTALYLGLTPGRVGALLAKGWNSKMVNCSCASKHHRAIKLNAIQVRLNLKDNGTKF